MRHRQNTSHLGRTPAHRKAMLRNLVTDFFRHEKVRTTQAKAKALRPYAEKLITMGKKDTLNARRQAARIVRDKAVLKKLFDELAPRYADRPGGYSRIIKLSSRAGDHAEMAIIELVEAEMKPRQKRQKPTYTGPLGSAAVEPVAATPAEAEDAVEEVQADGIETDEATEGSPEAADDAPEVETDADEDRNDEG